MAPDFSDSSTQNASFTCQNLRMGRLARKDFAGFDPLGPLWPASGPAAAGRPPDRHPAAPIRPPAAPWVPPADPVRTPEGS